MKRFIAYSLAFSLVLAFSSTASAKNNSQNNGNKFRNFEGNSGFLGELISTIKKHKHNDDDKKPDDRVPIDPGRGDGKDPSKNPEPPKRPGFVWVGDHWERERASSTSTGSPATGGTIVVRDHTSPYVVDASQASGGVIVTSGGPIIRDHRTEGSGPIIRDHRGSATNSGAASGGVTVTSGKPRPKGSSGGGILGSIGGALSDAAGAVGDAASSVGHVVTSGVSTVGRGASSVVSSAGKVVNSGINGANPFRPGSITPASKITVVRDHRN